MRILNITQEPPLDDSHVTTGNAVRSLQLTQALEGNGHHVEQIWLSKELGISGRRLPARSFRNHDELRGKLFNRKHDVLLVSYWELISLLPREGLAPVVLDLVAPRPLEELFETPERVQQNLRRLRSNLARCDLVMVGNSEQAQLLTYPLIEAGFDLRDKLPVIVVPLGAETVAPTHRRAPNGQWRLVAGGVNWPWRNGGSFATMLESIANDDSLPLCLVNFGGRYGSQPGPQDGPQDGLQDSELRGRGDRGVGIIHRPLMPYREYSEFLTQSCHIGVELAEWNIERGYSQSFRSLDFLRHGLPIICNDYLPIARQVEHFDAGWLVTSPESLPALLSDIVGDIDTWARKAANATALVESSFEPGRAVKPLLDWLAGMPGTSRLPSVTTAGDEEPVLGVPPWRTRLGNQLSLVKKVVFGKLFGRPGDNGVIVVTRGDLFPTDHGAAVRIVASARALAANGAEVAIVTDNRKHWYRMEAGQLCKEPYPFWTRLVSMPGWVVKLLHYSKDLPFSNAFLYLPLTDRSFYWRVLAVLARTQCRVLQAEFPAYAAPCLRVRNSMNVRVVLVQHNVEYERLKAQLPDLSDRQFENLKAIEIKLCSDVDAVVCVSDNDRQQLADDGVPENRLHTVAHGVDLNHFDQSTPIDIRQARGIEAHEPILAFHGTFSYPPNLKALQVLGDIILPGLERAGIKAHVIAIGKLPPATAAHPRIHLIGSVDELAPWLKACDLAVVPLTDGGGTRMKIIDCFAASLPVVTTSKGIEGIAAVPDQHAIFRDDWPGFIDAIAKLHNDPQRCKELATSGRELAESMDWSGVARRYADIYLRL